MVDQPFERLTALEHLRNLGFSLPKPAFPFPISPEIYGVESGIEVIDEVGFQCVRNDDVTAQVEQVFLKSVGQEQTPVQDQ